MGSYLSLTASWLRTKARNFMREEKGAGEIIAAVVVLAIVVVLGIAFQDKIVEFFNTLWGNATEGADTGIGTNGTKPT